MLERLTEQRRIREANKAATAPKPPSALPTESERKHLADWKRRVERKAAAATKPMVGRVADRIG